MQHHQLISNKIDQKFNNRPAQASEKVPELKAKEVDKIRICRPNYRLDN